MKQSLNNVPSARGSERILYMKDYAGIAKDFRQGPRRCRAALPQYAEQPDQSLSLKLLAAQEAERSRIARDLHDELGQGFAVLKLNLSGLKRELPEDLPHLKSKCEESLEHINNLLEHIRRISRDLSPSILEDLGLTVALRYLVRNFSVSHSIEGFHDIAELDHLFLPRDQIMLYRILQEALNNIGKHAQARRVAVNVRVNYQFLVMTIEDDGCGFDSQAVREQDRSERGIGLTTMAERARILGGTLQIQSSRGEGTLLTVRIPLEDELPVTP
ncbi:MAG TPA: sensor histidine kinase [Thermodesulfobacteriota bacterium]|nr:sensor histidine kinase [Thermodesulfobacteriota bacterium]